MKLSPGQRADIMAELVAALIPWKLTKAPPNREGVAKEVSAPFAAACWAKRYLEAIEDVLGKDEPESSPPPTETPAARKQAIPW